MREFLWLFLGVLVIFRGVRRLSYYQGLVAWGFSVFRRFVNRVARWGSVRRFVNVREGHCRPYPIERSRPKGLRGVFYLFFLVGNKCVFCVSVGFPNFRRRLLQRLGWFVVRVGSQLLVSMRGYVVCLWPFRYYGGFPGALVNSFFGAGRFRGGIFRFRVCPFLLSRRFVNPIVRKLMLFRRVVTHVRFFLVSPTGQVPSRRVNQGTREESFFSLRRPTWRFAYFTAGF